MLDFRLLGVLDVQADGVPLELGGPKQRAVLATLLLDANRVVSTDRLVDALWAETPPPRAVNTVQVYASRFRRLLGEGVVESHPTGYRLRVAPDALDLGRFEQQWRTGVEALRGGDAVAAAEALASALAEWRGDALADFVYEPFAEHEAARLEEMRLQAWEDYADARLGAHKTVGLVAELDTLVRAHPTRERLRAAQMLALYQAGRQADALASARQLRRALADELGIDPSPAITGLERRILNHDPTLTPSTAGPAGDTALAALAERRSLVCVDASSAIEWLAGLAAGLCAGSPDRELVVARLVPAGQADRLGEETTRLAGLRERWEAQGCPVRVAAFTSGDPAADAARMAAGEDTDLVLADGRAALRGEDLRAGISDQLLGEAGCDTGLVVGPDTGAIDPARGVLVPFGGSEHDWAALELGAWVARAHRGPLRVAGIAAAADRPDASRLLAEASLLLQRAVGVVAEPLLIAPGPDDVLRHAHEHGLLIVGLSADWRRHGLGPARFEIAQRSPVPAVFVRRGLRPGVLARREDTTRFRWSSVSSAAVRTHA